VEDSDANRLAAIAADLGGYIAGREARARQNLKSHWMDAVRAGATNHKALGGGSSSGGDKTLALNMAAVTSDEGKSAGEEVLPPCVYFSCPFRTPDSRDFNNIWTPFSRHFHDIIMLFQRYFNAI